MRIFVRCSHGNHARCEISVEIKTGTRIEDVLRRFHGSSLAVWISDYGVGNGKNVWKREGELTDGECYLICSKNVQKTLDAMDEALQHTNR